MDPNSLVLEISSDEDGELNDHVRGVSDDDCNWFAELFGDDSDAVVVVSESEKPVMNSNSNSKSKSKSKSKSNLKVKVKLKAKSKCDVADVDDECVVLDKDPNAPEVRNAGFGKGGEDDDEDSDEIVVVGEKGQIACRDYPHSRHLCIKFPFSTTPNENHCNQCYCYVCDSLAPCLYWGNGTVSTDHCHATDKDEFWIIERKNAKNGCKIVQPVAQLPRADLQTPAPALAQPQNQIPYPGLTHAYHGSANSQYPNFSGQYRNNILASRAKVHPDLASQFVLRAHQKYNLGSRVHKPVFKRHGPVRVGTTVNQTPYGSFRGNFGNLSRQQNYHQVNRMLSRSSKSLGSLQPNAVKTCMRYPFPSPTNASPSVNPQPLLHQYQVANHSNPNFQSHVNSNPFPRAMHFQQVNLVPPSSFIPQQASVQPSYVVQAEPVYPVPSKTIVDSPVVPPSDLTQNFSQENQAQGPIVDSGFEDNGLGGPADQDSAIPGCTGPTNNASVAPAVVSGLADYQYDWIFDDQHIEPGFTDYSSDSAYIDTGPIFDF